jgi:hypothetical protein
MKLRCSGDLFRQDHLKRLLDNKRQNKTTLLLQTSSVFLRKRTIYKNRSSLRQHCAVFHFQMPLEKSIIFLNHRNGFCECDVLRVCFSFSKKSLESYSYFVKIGRWYFGCNYRPPYILDLLRRSLNRIYNLPFNKGLYSRDVRCSVSQW